MEESSQISYFSTFKRIVFTVSLIILVRVFLLTPVVVDGASMLPTFEDGDKVIVYKQAKIEHFDIVVFKVSEDVNYIKRVVGLPGDHIAYRDDILFINDQPYEEPYLQANKLEIPSGTVLTEDFTLENYTGYSTIPEGFIFVLGDNRNHSLDSRDPSLGLVELEKVLGEVDVVIFPLSNMGLVE